MKNYGILKKTLVGVCHNLRKLTLDQKEWFLAKSKKGIRKRHKRKALKSNLKSGRSKRTSATPVSRKHIHQTAVVRAPKILSVFNNSTETLNFFDEVKVKIRSLNYKDNLFFDLSGIEIVSVGAIMYLIAMIKNTKRVKAMGINCAGNVPREPMARTIFETCGFYTYVSPQYNFKRPASNDHINITRGKEAAPEIAGNICEFVHAHSHCDRIATKALYKMILELMANTKQHAYTNNKEMDNNWYVYVEDCDKYLRFVFLDTGSGIPNTIRTKGILEKVKNYFSLNDAYFIASALRGELRSETGLSYRGKGLPEIYNKVVSRYISEFSIVSGYGKCMVDENGDISESNFENELKGTMLCWKLNKCEQENDYE